MNLSMEFDLTLFTLSPTTEEFNKCRKADLLQIADFFEIVVPREAQKQVVKKELYGKLVEAGILPEESVEGVTGEGAKAAGDGDTVSFPSIDPSYPRFDPVLAIKLKELDLQLKKQDYDAQLLHLRTIEVEADNKFKLRSLELQARSSPKVPVPVPRSRPSFPHLPGNVPVSPVQNQSPPVASSVGASAISFDVSKYVTLVPPFRETEVDSYFVAFERIAATLRWPNELWSLLLQCKLVGKAQEVCTALPIEQSLNYDTVKAAVLRAYELVPEAYRQKFRNHQKITSQTFGEFAREKTVLFDKWCAASRVTTFEQLRELLLLEDFKSCVSENIVVYLNEQKVLSLTDAAVLADEFVLTHKTVFTPSLYREKHSSSDFPVRNNSRVFFRGKGRGENREAALSVSRNTNVAREGERRVCFFCRDPGHLIADCKRWNQNKPPEKPKGVALVHTAPSVFNSSNLHTNLYCPFIMNGSVSLSGKQGNLKPISILRDTGSVQSFIVESALDFSEESYCGSSVLIRGIELGCVKVPLHSVYLQSDLFTGVVSLGVRAQLPIEGVGLILGNDIAGGEVFPQPIVVDKPDVSGCCEQVDVGQQFPSVFTACAVTRAQTKKFDEVLDVSETFMTDKGDRKEGMQAVSPNVCVSDQDVAVQFESMLGAGKELLAAAQKADPSLVKCLAEAVQKDEVADKDVAYVWEDGVLMRKWSPSEKDLSWKTVFQVVVPDNYREQILCLAHDHALSGHLGVNKTFSRILHYFYWPGLKKTVSEYCRSCHVCQLAGKPNQGIPSAPLHPIPIVSEPFERIIIDCVGPLPKTKSGYQYLLTLMCAATRYPEAIPMRTIRAKNVTKELVKFFSIFGIPRVIQSDQGTNFTSKLFSQVLNCLSVKHKLSSAYHPESQGALERFHQTLKSMLRTYCFETGKDWDEGVPLVMFAVRETVQESLGFSPADLVFGHNVRGPLKLFREQLLAETTPQTSVLEYVSSFRERLGRAREMALLKLGRTQSKMKTRFDKKSVYRSFQEGDLALVFLPLPGSPLQAKFSGPYTIKQKLSDTDYVINTPDRKRKTRVCHINMLKAYVMRDVTQREVVQSLPKVTDSISAAMAAVYCPEEDGLRMREVSCALLDNSKLLEDLMSHLCYLGEACRNDVIALIKKFPVLFSDVPSQTTVLEHDIDVGDCSPIKQNSYRVNPIKRGIMQEETAYLLEHGFAVPSSSPWSSPCLLVPKSGGKFRFCTDYRKVNSITKPDSYPLPRMDDCIDRVGAAKFVTKLDLLKGYWQIPLTARASEISAFVTPDHFLQYKRMAFGMRNAPATFQRLMRIVLAGLENCEAYLDDIVVYSSDWQQHLTSLYAVFHRLSDASLTLNLAKCEFGKAVVTYLGKCVGQGQVRPVDIKVECIIDFPAPKTKRELRRFLGMTGYYRAFCKNFAEVASPLTNLLGQAKVFEWTSECQSAFDAVKTLMCSAPVLSAPDFSRPFKLEVDASEVGAGAVLIQEDDTGIDHPVSYFSRKFTKSQQRYSTIEKEALALLLALQHFEIYLDACNVPILVYTDHNPLVFLFRMSNSNQRLMRWSLLIQGFNLEIRHKKGCENVLADALSRAPCNLGD